MIEALPRCLLHNLPSPLFNDRRVFWPNSLPTVGFCVEEVDVPTSCSSAGSATTSPIVFIVRPAPDTKISLSLRRQFSLSQQKTHITRGAGFSETAVDMSIRREERRNEIRRRKSLHRATLSGGTWERRPRPFGRSCGVLPRERERERERERSSYPIRWMSSIEVTNDGAADQSWNSNKSWESNGCVWMIVCVCARGS